MADHPTPWQWLDTEAASGAVLADARGYPIIVAGYNERVEDLYVRTVTAAAPDLEQILRGILGKRCDAGDCVDCGSDLQRGEPHADDCKIGPILNRIDKAKAGG